MDAWGRISQEVRLRYAISKSTLAIELGVGQRTVSGCEGGWKPLPYPAKMKLLDMINRLEDHRYSILIVSDPKTRALIESFFKEKKTFQKRLLNGSDSEWAALLSGSARCDLSDQMLRKIRLGVRKVPVSVKCDLIIRDGIALDETCVMSLMPGWIQAVEHDLLSRFVRSLAVH